MSSSQPIEFSQPASQPAQVVADQPSQPDRVQGTYKKWTAEEDALIIELRKQGLTWRNIEKHLADRTEWTIKSRWNRALRDRAAAADVPVSPSENSPSAERADVVRQYWSAEDDALVIELKKQGLSYQNIAKHFTDRNENMVSTRWHRHLKDRSAAVDVPMSQRNYRQWTKEDDDTVTDLRGKGIGLKEIGRRMGRHESAVLRRLAKLADTPGSVQTNNTHDLTNDISISDLETPVNGPSQVADQERPIAKPSQNEQPASSPAEISHELSSIKPSLFMGLNSRGDVVNLLN